MKLKNNIEMVTLYNGLQKPKKKCQLIDDKYYLIDLECFFDEDSKKWKILNRNLSFPCEFTNLYFNIMDLERIIYVKDDAIQKGYIQKKLYLRGQSDNSITFLYYNKERTACKSKDLDILVNKFNYVWAFKENILLCPISAKDPSLVGEYLNKKKSYKVEVDNYILEDSKNYNKIKNNLIEYNSKLIVDNSLKPLDVILKDYTFGCEIEVITGYIRQSQFESMGWLVCKDGSINYAPEFVSSPLYGLKGVQNLKNFFKIIEKQTTVDHTGSLHFHIGNLNMSRLHVIALYKLYHDIQDELYSFMPFYKKHWKDIKKKDYCAPLPKLFDQYDEKEHTFKNYVRNSYIQIEKFILNNIGPNDQFNKNNQNNPWGKNKWEILARYYGLNFVNLFFTNRGTVEFRLHHSVVDYNKVLYWLIFCLLVIDYSQNKPKNILSSNKKTFMDVMEYSLKKYSNSKSNMIIQDLMNYFLTLKKYHNRENENSNIDINEPNTNLAFLNFKPNHQL